MNTPPGSTQENEIDLLRLVGELWDHRKFIISVTALFTLIAVKHANLSGRYSGPG
ncbi:tyrosine protein kinase [Escherichia coli N37139PS]|nr:tyrosine protein kinase [Escherichia coli N37139PS]